MDKRLRAVVVTVSDGVTHGTRKDESGDVAEELLRAAGFDVAERHVVPDERTEIEPLLSELSGRVPLVVTTGGTGFGPRDVTPEATRAVIDREAPGIPELMRSAGLAKTPMAALSRAVAGSRGAALILNLPGSPKGVRESLEAVLPVVRHAVEVLTGQMGEHPTGHATTPEEAYRAWVVGTAVKIAGSPPCRVGSRVTIVPDGPFRGTLGCAEFDEEAATIAPEVLASGEPQTRTLHHELGDVEVLFEPHLPPPRLVLVSATDVARELLTMAHRLGFEPALVEPRGERILPSDRALAANVAVSFDDLEFDHRTDVVFTDHDAPGVAEQLAHVLRTPARFVGVMGSRRHVGHYLEELREMGFAEDDLARIRSPVGLDLGGRTPEEIAFSIAAGLVAARYGRDGGWLDRP